MLKNCLIALTVVAVTAMVCEAGCRGGARGTRSVLKVRATGNAAYAMNGVGTVGYGAVGYNTVGVGAVYSAPATTMRTTTTTTTTKTSSVPAKPVMLVPAVPVVPVVPAVPATPPDPLGEPKPK